MSNNKDNESITANLDQCINQYASTILHASKIQRLKFNIKHFDLQSDLRFFKSVSRYEDAINKIDTIIKDAFPDLNMSNLEINTYNIGALSVHFFKLFDEMESFNKHLNNNDKQNIFSYMNKRIKFYINIIALK